MAAQAAMRLKAAAEKEGKGDDTKEEKAAPAVMRSQKYNIGQYRGLVDTVSTIRDKVDREREESRVREEGLKVQLADKIVKGEKVQKELSIQLRCAGRSYAQILDANRELGDQMRVEIDQRETVIAQLHHEIKKRDEKIRVADKPWKEALSKQELKLLKLQENNADLRVKVREEAMKVPPIHEHYKKKIAEKEAAMQTVLRESEGLREEIQMIHESHAVEIQKTKAPFHKQILELQRANRDSVEAAEDREAIQKRECKRLENKIVGLQKELDKVDHTPYERKIDTLQDGFNRLIKDFEIKTQLNSENVVKMREGFENVIEGLDRQIQNNERESQRRLQPYLHDIEKKELKIEKLQNKIVELRNAEQQAREKEKLVIDDLRDELKVCKEAVDLYLKEMNKSKRELEAVQRELEQDNGPMNRMKAMERRLEEVTQQCAMMIKHKDLEIQDKNQIVQRLQRKLQVDSRRFQEFAETWDHRVQEKEQGYNKAIAELAFAEGQILEERKRTEIEREKVKARERDIVRLKAEHTEELKVRERYRLELEVKIQELEVKMEEVGDTATVVAKLQNEIDFFRRRMEERVADLRVEMVRRDRLKEEVEVKLTEVQHQWDQARMDWEEKERELEVNIRTRDRTILALKNELEFLNDNWEIKYARLVNLYEKLQKKYEETTGPNGVQEAFRRAIYLKIENEALHEKIYELREVIQKQKKAIRGLQLDLDQLMKETADLIAEKERGIAEMAGDYVKLENIHRDEQTLRVRLLKQKDAERLALAESFQARVEQLEQIMEAMRFNDRQDLLDKIKLWKKNYERVCNERDEVEDHYKALVERKESQLQGMLLENDQERQKTEDAHTEWGEKHQALEHHWRKKQVGWHEEKEGHEQHIRDLKAELDKQKLLAQKRRVQDGPQQEDPEIALLKEKVKELEGNILATEDGIQKLIEENSELRVETVAVEEKKEDLVGPFKRKLEVKDKQMAEMEIRHEELKEVLKMEMQRAQTTCKDLEDQIKRFPDPFLDEINEMKEKYAQMQSGMQRIQMENLNLRESNEKNRKEMEREIKDLEKSLSLAKTLLQEVSTLESLRHLHTSEARKAEEDLGLKL